MATRSWDGTLRGAIPAAGPGDSHAVDVTPGDLPALTNAGQVASADYLDAGGRRLGTVLAVETVGTTYEHGKAICDRASGSTLDRIDATALESGATLLRAAYRDGKGRTGDVATEFKIYANPDGSREAYASWLRDGYPAPRADQRVLNVQAWSAIPGYELALADAILAGTGATLHEGATSPTAFVTSARSLGGTISADVGGAATGLNVRTTRLLEDGTTATELAPLAGGHFAGRFAKTLETTLDLVDSSGKTVDRVWLSDGAWALLDDAVVGGAAGAATVETTGCRRTTSTVDTDLALAGCAHFSGEVHGLAGVARNLARAVSPLDIHDYEGISFTYASNLPVRACLEQAGRAASAQPCVTLAPSATTTVTLPVSAFAAESDGAGVDGNGCATTPKVGLTAVTFVAATGTGATSLALAIDELTFHRAAPAAASTLATSSCISTASELPSTPGTVPATGDSFAAEASCAVTPTAGSGGPGTFGALVAALAALVGVGRKRRA
jgi:MYXO-CTERM domain-containing protein